MTSPALSERVRAQGVVGAGGAGFPTYRKLERPAEVVIANGAECEPLLHKDKELLRHHAEEVIEGLALVVAAVGAREGILAVKEKYADLVAELRSRAEPRGFRVFPLGDFYPSGDEFVTVYECTGRIIPPGGLPADVGCLVVNVETLRNVARDEPVTHKYLTVAGAVPEPMTVRVPVGTSYRDVLAAAGVDPERLGAVLVGGVMMGRLMQSADEVVTRTTGGLVCLPPGHRLTERYRTDARARDLIGKSACDQCSFCTELCPRYLLGHPIEPHKAMRNLMFHMVEQGPGAPPPPGEPPPVRRSASPSILNLVLGSQFCCECNLCSLYACPEDLFPKDACADNKRFMRQERLAHPKQGQPTSAHSVRDYRRTPLSSLIRKLGLFGFENAGPLSDREPTPATVRIPLRMHVGEPALACVAPGDRVRAGQEIGRAPSGLGVPVHASVAGTVESVAAEVVIRRADA